MINKQDFINAITQNIDIVRGDTLAFSFQLAGLGSRGAYEDLAVTFAVAEHYEDAVNLIESNIEDGITLESYNTIKDIATFTVVVEPNKTKYLDIKRYYYDLQIKDEVNVITLMRGYFTLVYDVAN